MDKLIRASEILQEIQATNIDEERIDEASIQSMVKKMFVALAKKMGFGKKTPYWTDKGFYEFKEWDQSTDQNGLPILVGAQSLEGDLYGWALFGIRRDKKPRLPSENPDDWSKEYGSALSGSRGGSDFPFKNYYYIGLSRYLPTATEDSLWFLYKGRGPKDVTDSYNEYEDRSECKAKLQELIHIATESGIAALKLQTDWKRMIIDKDSWDPYDPVEKEKKDRDYIEVLSHARFDVDNVHAPFDKAVVADEFDDKEWAWEVTGFETTILGVTGYRIVLNQGVIYATPWVGKDSPDASDAAKKQGFGRDYKVMTRSRYLYRGPVGEKAAQLSANGRYNDYFDLSDTKGIVKDLTKRLTARGLVGINFPRDWSNVDRDRNAFSGD